MMQPVQPIPLRQRLLIIIKSSLYTSFPSQDYARKAVRFERRLELAMEGQRFFDLVRWGIAATTINALY